MNTNLNNISFNIIKNLIINYPNLYVDFWEYEISSGGYYSTIYFGGIYTLRRDDYFYNSLWNDLRYESKEDCINAAENKVDELVKNGNWNSVL